MFLQPYFFRWVDTTNQHNLGETSPFQDTCPVVSLLRKAIHLRPTPTMVSAPNGRGSQMMTTKPWKIPRVDGLICWGRWGLYSSIGLLMFIDVYSDNPNRLFPNQPVQLDGIGVFFIAQPDGTWTRKSSRDWVLLGNSLGTLYTFARNMGNLVGGLEHLDYFSIQLGRISPTYFHIFQRGWNHQPDIYI